MQSKPKVNYDSHIKLDGISIENLEQLIKKAVTLFLNIFYNF